MPERIVPQIGNTSSNLISLSSVVQWPVFSKHIGKILSLGSILRASKDLVLYVSMTEINVLCGRTMQLFNLESLFS